MLHKPARAGILNMEYEQNSRALYIIQQEVVLWNKLWWFVLLKYCSMIFQDRLGETTRNVCSVSRLECGTSGIKTTVAS
jgi:hypothetical protein